MEISGDIKAIRTRNLKIVFYNMSRDVIGIYYWGWEATPSTGGRHRRSVNPIVLKRGHKPYAAH